MAEDVARIAPVRGRARIDVLDVLRGLAILGIFYMNIPAQASSVTKLFFDVRLIGWSAIDKAAWVAVDVLLEGTQRGMLELLFGAGFMVLTARAMTPDGPVAIADLFMRRTLWLLAFGLVNVFVVLWVGDILTVYALASLFLFPFRKLGPKTLVAIGSLFALVMAVMGTVEYASRVSLVNQVATAEARQAAGQAPTAVDTKALAEWRKKQARFTPTEKIAKDLVKERKAHAGGWFPYASYLWDAWTSFMVGKGLLLVMVAEAFGAMLIGAALWKWRIVQGGRNARFYLWLTVAMYGFGITARAIGAAEFLAFAPIPKTMWITEEAARLATSIGHVAIVNLAMKSLAGARLLSPFKAVGRAAFSVYFLEQVIGLHILFAPYGLNLWDRYGHAAQFAIATGVIVVCTIVANLWMRSFANGPMEWAWRSLSYWQWQPFRRRAGAVDDVLPGPALVAA